VIAYELLYEIYQFCEVLVQGSEVSLVYEATKNMPCADFAKCELLAK